MVAKKTDKLDEVKPIQEVIEDTSEHEVINIRIPRKKDDKKADSRGEGGTPKADQKKDEKPPSETKDAKDESPNTSDDSTKAVSSFSLLDADTEEKGGGKPKEEPKKDTLVPPATPETPKEEPEDATANVKKWLDDVQDEDVDDDSGEGKSKKKIFLLILLVFIIMAVVGGGVYYYQSNLETTTETVTDPQSELGNTEPTNTPTPTEIEIEVSSYSINILNGSGIPGEAGNVETLLLEEGFETTETGNADATNYKETIIKVKEDTPEGVIDIIKQSIGSSYVITISKIYLGKNSDFDVEITLGSLEPTPTPQDEEVEEEVIDDEEETKAGV